MNSYYRKQVEQIHIGASDFIRSWMKGLVVAADHGDEQSEATLKLFLKYRKQTDRSNVAYAMVMDQQAQQQLKGLEGD